LALGQQEKATTGMKQARGFWGGVEKRKNFWLNDGGARTSSKKKKNGHG